MNALGNIYALIDPRLASDHIASIKYIGMTASSIERRMRQHLTEARSGRRDYYHLRWLRSLLEKGMKPLIIQIEKVPAECLPERESQWIAAHRGIGCRLTNATDGGAGVKNPSEETRAKLRNRIITAETRAKLALINKGKRHSQETRAKISQNRKGVKPPAFSEEHRKNMSHAKMGNRAWLGKHHTDASKKKCSAAKIGNSGRLGMPHSQATKMKIGISHAGDKSSTAKLTWDQVFEIRRLVAAGSTQTAAAKLFGVTPPTVSEIVANKIWRVAA